MRIVNLFSGSAGNCTFVRRGDASILIDAGGSARSVLRSIERIGEDCGQIRAIFVTHEHSDHISALRTLLKKISVPVFVPSGCADRVAAAVDVMADRIEPIAEGGTLRLCDFSVTPFRVPHDSDDCFGYRIGGGERTLGVMTDAGMITDSVTNGLLGCTDALLEANHDPDMVLCNTSYPQSLKDRILSGGGHLSNEACARLIAGLAPHGLRRVMLSHLSRENNTPDKAEKAVMLELSRNNVVGVSVCSASACTETELF